MNKNKTITDLIEDGSFVNWVNQSNETDFAKWELWVADNSDYADLVEEAKMIVMGFSFKKDNIDSKQTDNSWNNFAAKINQPKTPPTPIRKLPNRLLKIAAVFFIGIFSIWGIQKWMNTSNSEPIVYQTKENQIETFALPDGSTLTLNTNSKAALSSDKNNNTIVNLEGEGYFNISKQQNGRKLQVLAKDLRIEVVGTAFNVNNKRVQPIVSLTEGKVDLVQKNFGTKKLTAGQTAVFNSTNNQFEISSDQTDYWKSWTLQKWSLGKSTSVKELLNRIQETFELEIQVSDNNIYTKNASGDVSVENKAVLFEALSILLDLEFKEENGTLFVTPLVNEIN